MKWRWENDDTTIFGSTITNPYFAQKMLPVDLRGGVALQFEAWVGRQELVQVDPIARLVIGPFNPITTELGQQNQGKLTLSAENLTETANKNNYCDGRSYKHKINSTEISTAKMFSVSSSVWTGLPHGRWGKGCSLPRSVSRWHSKH